MEIVIISILVTKNSPDEYRNSFRMKVSTRRNRANTAKAIEFGKVPEKGQGEHRNTNRIWVSIKRIRSSP